MSGEEINILRRAVSNRRVFWIPDTKTAFEVEKIAQHAEEGDGWCAIFSQGEYAALYNTPLSDFFIIDSLA